MLDFLKQHALTLLLIASAVFTFDWLFQTRKRLRLKWYAALILAVLHIAIGVASVKAFAIVEAGFDLEKAGNMSLFGSIAFLPIFYFAGAKLFKRSPADVFDIFTIPLAATLMCARVNCLVTGCCLGDMIPGTQVRWPTREIELVFYAAFIAVMIAPVFKGKTRGRAFPIFMIAYGAFRFVIEYLRVNESLWWVFHLSHIWALASILIGVVVLILLRRRQNAEKNN